MEKRRNMVEVLGVPDVLPDHRTAEKLQVYFLQAKHGGGEVLEVLYPCFIPGLAVIVFEEPDVAARVLRMSRHVLEVKGQRYPLTVKAVDPPKMDLPAEATIHLDVFSNESQVRQLLRSHGFLMTDLSRDRISVKGSFSKLKTVKALLEPLVRSQTRAGAAAPPSSPPKASSRAAPPYQSRSSANAAAAASSHSTNNVRSAENKSSSSSLKPDQRCLSSLSFVIDSDVIDYARRLRRKEVEAILESHDVRMDVCPLAENAEVTLKGRSTRAAAAKLQDLLANLGSLLRTQEVRLRDMSRDGKALFERIQKNRNIQGLVLLRPKGNAVCLIGPSGQSYQLKQRLLGLGDPSEQTGRTPDKNPKTSSRPPNGANLPSRAEAAGDSASKRQDVHEAGAGPGTKVAAVLKGLMRRTSKSPKGLSSPPGKTNGDVQDAKKDHREQASNKHLNERKAPKRPT